MFFVLKIPAWAIALLVLGLDYATFNVPAFGGSTAGYLMIHYLVWKIKNRIITIECKWMDRINNK